MNFDHIPATSGIYAIVNKTNSDRYVGYAKNMRTRVRQHFRELARGTHKTNEERVLQNAWDEFGSDAFEFTVLELVYDNLPEIHYHVRADNLALAEHFYINEKGEYNIDTRIVRDEFSGLVDRRAWREPTPDYARRVADVDSDEETSGSSSDAAADGRGSVQGQSGVFAIVNRANGDRYVGAAADFRRQVARYLGQLKSGRCQIAPLQEAWDAHGEDAFEMTVLEEVRDNRNDADYKYPDNLALARQHYINERSEYNRDKAWVARKYRDLVEALSWREGVATEPEE